MGVPAVALTLSIVTIAVELALPIVLRRVPGVGFMLAVALHASLALLIPDVGAFSLVMLAMATTFLPSKERNVALNASA